MKKVNLPKAKNSISGPPITKLVIDENGKEIIMKESYNRLENLDWVNPSENLRSKK